MAETDASVAGPAPPISAGLPGEDLSWITSTHIDDANDGVATPLPADASTEVGADIKPTAASAEEPKPPVVEEPKPAEEKPAIEAKPAAPKPDEVAAAKAAEAKPEDEVLKAADLDPELTPAESDLIKTLPEADRAEAVEKAKKSRYFKDHFRGTRPISEINQHLQELSPSRHAELTSAIIADNLAKPDEFCRSLYEKDPQSYSKLATEVVRGSPATIIQIATGRAATPEEVTTALDFHERYKDNIPEAGELTEFDDEKKKEWEQYFPDDVPLITAQLAAAKKDREELAALKSKEQPQPDEKATEAAKASEAAAQAAIVREVNGLWDVARDTIGNYVESLATNPQNGAGVYVSPEERKAANADPNSITGRVALLKDLKANILFDGLNSDGKELLPKFEQGFTEWGKEREPFKDALAHMMKYTEAREKDNVLAGTTKLFPSAKTFYEERLKHPIFSMIDDLITFVVEKGSVAPKVDAQIPGQLPSAAGGGKAAPGANGNANDDSWLIADGLARSTK